MITRLAGKQLWKVFFKAATMANVGRHIRSRPSIELWSRM
jgi:hypothetical protein